MDAVYDGKPWQGCLCQGRYPGYLLKKGGGMAQKQIVSRTQIAKMQGTSATNIFSTAALVLLQHHLVIAPSFKHSGFI